MNMPINTQNMEATRSSVIPHQLGDYHSDNDGLARVAAIHRFPELATDMGISPDELLVRYGLSSEIFKNTENIIPLSLIDKILQDAADATGCQHFGLLLGERQNPDILGVLLLIMQQMGTIKEAFAAMQQHFHRNNIGASFSLQECGDLAELSYEIWSPNAHKKMQGLSLALAITFKLMQQLAGIAWLPTEVHFSFEQPQDTTPYQRFFNAPVYFGQDKCCIYFPVKWLRAPVKGRNTMFNQIINHYLASDIDHFNVSWSTQVECLIKTLMPQGQANIDHVSRAFGISRRTLHRRLSSEGYTFEKILQRVRFAVIDQLLMRPELSLSEIALMAGFSDSSAFSRAFSNKYKMPPKKRRELLQGSAQNISRPHTHASRKVFVDYKDQNSQQRTAIF